MHSKYGNHNMTKLALVPSLQKNETLQSLECEEL
jgi:hypothetical protein